MRSFGRGCNGVLRAVVDGDDDDDEMVREPAEPGEEVCVEIETPSLRPIIGKPT